MSIIECQSRPQVDSLLSEILKSTHYKYVISTVTKSFNNEDWKPTEKDKVFFERKSSGKTTSIPFTGIPFVSVGTKYLICHQGRDKNKSQKKKYAEKKMKFADHEQKQRRYLVQDTKKVDCPAVVNVTRVATFLDEEFKVEKNSVHHRKQASNHIKNALLNNENVIWENRYYVYVSRFEEHTCHPIIEELNHVWNIKNSTHNVFKHSSDDQENLQILIQDWSDRKPDDNFFLRTCQGNEEFLLCYQTKWQKRLLQMYGQDICLLDATYKTTRYSLAMFFLVVQTNVCNLVVAVFVVQQETAEAIAEGLHKLKEWNEGWSPGHFMVDLNKSEIDAVESVFPGSKAVLCDFYRNKAWEEWTKHPDNGIQDQKAALTLLQRIASSDTLDKYEQSVKDLEDSKEWKRNSHFQQWFQINWLPESKRWVTIFRVDTLHLNITTNNGIDRLNETFKHIQLNNQNDDTVSDMMSIVVLDFIPSLHKKYSQLNIQFSSVYKKYNQTVPRFLHNRPRDIVKHILFRYYASLGPENVTKITDVTFNVKSESGTVNYQISLGSNVTETDSLPSCGCPDWKKHKLPCKHLCAVFKAGWSWDYLCPKYRDSPFLALDPIYFSNSSDNQPNETEEIYTTSYIGGQGQEQIKIKKGPPEEVDVVVVELDESVLLEQPIIKKERKITTNVVKKPATIVEELQSRCAEENKSMLELFYLVQDEGYLKSLEVVLQDLKNDIAAHVPQEAGKALNSVLKKKRKRKRNPNANPNSLAKRIYGSPKTINVNMAEFPADLKKTTFRAAVDVSQSEQKIALTSIIDSEGQQWDIQGQGYV